MTPTPKPRSNKPRPTFKFERAVLKRLPGAMIAGIDEVGCAPLAAKLADGMRPSTRNVLISIPASAKLVPALRDVLTDSPLRRRQVEAFAGIDRIMSTGDQLPSARAADIVLKTLRRARGSSEF